MKRVCSQKPAVSRRSPRDPDRPLVYRDLSLCGSLPAESVTLRRCRSRSAPHPEIWPSSSTCSLKNIEVASNTRCRSSKKFYRGRAGRRSLATMFTELEAMSRHTPVPLQRLTIRAVGGPRTSSVGAQCFPYGHGRRDPGVSERRAGVRMPAGVK